MREKLHSFDSMDVASEFLRLAEEDNKTFTSMQINKLVYIAHGFFVGNTGNPLLNEDVQAWQYGPVIKSLYREFKRFGRGIIDNNEYAQRETGLSGDAKTLIKMVFEEYKDYTAWQLSALTHQKGTPWQLSYDGMHNTVIPHDAIHGYYKSLISDAVH